MGKLWINALPVNKKSTTTMALMFLHTNTKRRDTPQNKCISTALKKGLKK